MAHAYQPYPQNRRHRTVWRRRQHRPWTRPEQMPSPLTLLAAIPSLPRATLARLTTRMIDRMDELDGDPDREGGWDDDESSHDQEQAYD